MAVCIAACIPTFFWMRNVRTLNGLKEETAKVQAKIAKKEKKIKKQEKKIEEAKKILANDTETTEKTTDTNEIKKEDDTLKGLNLSLDESCIFVGDSIFDTLATSNVLPKVQYLTLIGLNVDSVQNGKNFMTKNGKVDGLTAIENSGAKNVFITLGVNGMGWMEPDYMIGQYEKFIKKIQDLEEEHNIFVMAVSPITREFKPETKGEGFTQEQIDAYNEKQEAMAKKMGVYYIDAASVLKDDTNQLKAEYDDGDGLHWTQKGCEKFSLTLKQIFGIVE